MNNEYDTNPEIPELPNPITPERSPIEIWPGRPRESKPVPLEGPGRPVRETDVESTPPTPKTQSGGSGRGGSGSKQPPSSSDPSNFPFGQPGQPGQPGKPDFPSVDEISSYWSFRNKSEFGIAVSSRGLDHYAEAITIKLPSITYDKARNIAENFAVQHQVHHFLVDRAVETMEALTGDSLWLPMQKNFANNKYGYSPLEESLSCAYARRCMTNATSVKGFNVLLALQPSGYQLCKSDGKEIKTNGGSVTHAQALSALLSGYVQRTDKPQSRIIGLHGLMLFKNHIDGTNGDLYFSVNGNKKKLQVFFSK
jgi:hypothetical protein